MQAIPHKSDIAMNTFCLVSTIYLAQKLAKDSNARGLFATSIIKDKNNQAPSQNNNQDQYQKQNQQKEDITSSSSWDVFKYIWDVVTWREIGVGSCVILSLLARTLCDLRMIRLQTNVESNLVARRKKETLEALLNFALFMLPVSCVNAILAYSQDELSITLRECITKRLQNKYYKNKNFYYILHHGRRKHGNNNNNNNDDVNIEGSNENITHPEQMIAHDVEDFAKMISNLFSGLLKPSVDVIIYTQRLWSTFGSSIPSALGSYLLAAGVIVNGIRKPLARFVQGEQQLEAEFHSVTSRMVTYAEEVAFLDGAKKEKTVAMKALERLCDYIRSMYRFRRSVGVLDQLVSRYGATLLGWLVICRPFLDTDEPSMKEMDHTAVHEKYNTVFRMTRNMASAVGQLVISGRDFLRLTGMGKRLLLLDRALDTADTGIEQTTTTNSSSTTTTDDDDGGVVSTGERDIQALINASSSGPGLGLGGKSMSETTFDASARELLRMHNITLATPNGHVLLEGLSLVLREGLSVLVVGPNGSGKSSLLRTIANIWRPPIGRMWWGVPMSTISSDVRTDFVRSPFIHRSASRVGSVYVTNTTNSITDDDVELEEKVASPISRWSREPMRPHVFFLSQKPFMALGNLRDQITYPRSFSVSARVRMLALEKERSDESIQNGKDNTEEDSNVDVDDSSNPFIGDTDTDSSDVEGKDTDAETGNNDDDDGDKITLHDMDTLEIEKALNQELYQLLRFVKLDHVLNKYGWDEVVDWEETLSGGEKQRLCMARLYFHRPRLAVLDECTSALDDIQTMLFNHCRSLGITCLTVSHRKNLVQFHTKYLRFNGHGGYEYGDITKGDSFGLT